MAVIPRHPPPCSVVADDAEAPAVADVSRMARGAEPA